MLQIKTSRIKLHFYDNQGEDKNAALEIAPKQEQEEKNECRHQPLGNKETSL